MHAWWTVSRLHLRHWAKQNCWALELRRRQAVPEAQQCGCAGNLACSGSGELQMVSLDQAGLAENQILQQQGQQCS